MLLTFSDNPVPISKNIYIKKRLNKFFLTTPMYFVFHFDSQWYKDGKNYIVSVFTYANIWSIPLT